MILYALAYDSETIETFLTREEAEAAPGFRERNSGTTSGRESRPANDQAD